MKASERKLWSIDLANKLQAIILAHKEGKPVIREMADRIKARETLK